MRWTRHVKKYGRRGATRNMAGRLCEAGTEVHRHRPFCPRWEYMAQLELSCCFSPTPEREFPMLGGRPLLLLLLLLLLPLQGNALRGPADAALKGRGFPSPSKTD